MKSLSQNTLTQDQVTKLKHWSNGFERTVQECKSLHNLLNLIILCGCLLVWIRITFIHAAVLEGSLYYFSALLSGVMTYSLMVFSYHEGLNNNQIFIGTAPLIEVLRYISSNLYKFAILIPALVMFKHSEIHTASQRVLYIGIVFSLAYLLDTLRKYVEYNLLPNGENSLRSLGTGFWATLIGGGPWGQPCTLIQRLCPNLPWYGRIMGHYKLSGLLTTEQRQVLMPLEKRNFLFVLAEIYLSNLNYSSRLNK